MSEGQLLVAAEGPLALMRVVGRGTYKLAIGFKAWINEIISSGTVRSVMLDLSECSSMDSTFMGLMVTLAIQTKNRVALLVVNASPEHHTLLDGIGVTRVWKYVDAPVAEINWTSLVAAASGAVKLDEQTRDIILEAHQNLMEFDEKNIPKFKDVIELIKQDLNP